MNINRPFGRTVAAIICCWLIAVGGQSIAADAEKQPPIKQTEAKSDETKSAEPKSDAAAEHPWPIGLEAGKRRALAAGRPLLVRVGATWCGPCRKLDQEIAKPEVQDELARWALVYIDVDASPEEATQMEASAIPALRIINLRGRIVASQKGFLTADELLAWLKENFDQGTPAADELLTAAEPPDADAIGRLIEVLQRQDPADREAAIRRLMPFPKLSAGKVVEAFAKGKLATRLATLELLHEWRAPVDQLDPWRPQTLTPERQSALRKWAGTVAATQGERPTQLSRVAADAARRDLVRLGEAPETEAIALAERLVRLGPPLSPLVAAQLKETTTDHAHERLLAMRYRLVATDALALSWPGGLARLAATDTGVRHKAVEELLARATPAEQPLLLELFSDSDPLVRELSLRGLLTVGGPDATGALVKLLDDPEPNVRAAVLKQLAEQPAPALVPRIAQYVTGEKIPDLVVHAIRFLKETKDKKATECLIGLLKHESWQVRAEAAEALTKNREGGDPEQMADIYVSLIGLLNDSDSFVISRAMQGLARADLPTAVDPLVRVAVTHPELATDAVNVLVAGQKMRVKAIPAFRKFAADKEPNIRAAAIKGLLSAAPDECDHELIAALNDDASVVRRTAAEAIFKLFNAALEDREYGYQFGRRRVQISTKVTSPTTFFSSLMNQLIVDVDPQELKMLRYRAGQGRPAWAAATVEPLAKMLKAKSSDEQVAAALALLPLAHEKEALPVLKQATSREPARIAAVAAGLVWLPWKDRLDLFNHLVELKPANDQLMQIVFAMSRLQSVAADEVIWRLVERGAPSDEVVAGVYDILQPHYEIQTDNNSDPNQQVELPKARADDLLRRARKGAPAERLVALALLLGVDRDQAGELATAIVDDAKSPPVLRREALRFLLMIRPEADAQKQAVQRMADKDSALRRIALVFLVEGADALRAIEGNPLTLYNIRNSTSTSFDGQAKPIEVTAPEGISADVMGPMLHDADPEIAASAGYLLATMGKTEGFDPLLNFWRKKKMADTHWTRMVYRAITALDDDRQTPLLIELYGRRDTLDMKDFYWTIRSMHGPAVLALRKRIRDEVGVENLR